MMSNLMSLKYDVPILNMVLPKNSNKI